MTKSFNLVSSHISDLSSGTFSSGTAQEITLFNNIVENGDDEAFSGNVSIKKS
jgi:hypothetical protein